MSKQDDSKQARNMLLGAAGGLLLGAVGGYLIGSKKPSEGPGSWADMPLKPSGIRAGADTGNPYVSAVTFPPGNLKAAGLWECQPGGFPVVDRPSTETVYIVSGKATITDQDGTKTELKPGSFHTLPTGWSGRWDVTETIRKVYVITK